MFQIYIFILFIFFSVKCDEDYILIKAKFSPKTNTILYNGNKYSFTPPESFSEEKIEDDKPYQQRFLQEAEKARLFSGAFWFNLVLFVTLACFAGTMSGLTVGYLSIDSLILEIKISNGTTTEKDYAKKILRLVSNHHWLLVTLLLCNSFACEAMPIFLSKLVNEMVAIILSVTVLLFVGEIIPQALCTGPNQMKIASFLAPFTYSLMIITYPISYPIALFMDYVIGVQGKSRFCNSDLKSIIDIHVQEIVGNLSRQQLNYFTGFLDIMNKKIGELILPIEKTLKLDYNSKLSKTSIKRLIDSGYSRIPVYDKNPNNLIGILRMKKLVGKDLSRPYTLKQLGIDLTNPIRTSEDTLFLDLFDKFKDGKSHMAFILQKESDLNTSANSENLGVNSTPMTPIKGIITLEDLIEFWLKIPIMDEEDYIHSDQYRPKRKKSFYDIVSSKDLTYKLNKLITFRSPESNRKNAGQNIAQINGDNDMINNYHPLNKNDDETEELLSFLFLLY